ncbi:MAG: hypothetical protein N4A59_11120 [Marinifilum sp.]|jgi:hypothetical protein|nr:hypothetical protein [Marinifilum sp.]
MGNNSLTLAQKQKKQFQTKVCTYKFKASMKGAKKKWSPELNVHRTGIKLHFFRYALFPNSMKNDQRYYVFDYTGEIEKQPKELFPNGAPNVDGFYYGRTTLTDGYLYLMDANNPDLWWEIMIDNVGNYFPVYWEKWTDEREASNKTIKQLIFDPDTELWVAYSLVQWSIDYHHLMRTDKKRRNERMIKIKCTGFKQNEEPTTSDIVPYNHMFCMGQDDFKIEKLLHVPAWHEIYAGNKSDLQKDSEAKKEDMFITLQTPLPCLLDIYRHLDKKLLDFKTFVDAIQTGETIEEVKERYAQKILQPTEVDIDYLSLFILASTTYKYVYESRSNTEKYDGGKPGINFNDTHDPYEHKDHLKILNKKTKKWTYNLSDQQKATISGYALKAKQDEIKSNIPYYKELEHIGYGVDRKKVETILGVHERKKMRKEINKIRDAYGTFLSSKYVRETLDDFLHNCPNNTLTGKALLLEAINALLIEPHKVDKLFTLKKDIPQEVDKWQELVYQYTNTCESPKDPIDGLKSRAPFYNGQEPLYAIISGQLNITNVNSVNKIDISNKIAGVYKNRLDVLKELVYECRPDKNGVHHKIIRYKANFIFKRFKNDVHVFNQNTFEVRNGELKMNLDRIGGELDDKLVKFGKYSGKKEITRIIHGPEKMISRKFGRTEINLPVMMNGDEVSTLEVAKNKRNIAAGQLLESKPFTGVLTGLQILNFSNALQGYIEDPNGKSFMNALGIGSDLSEAALRLHISNFNHMNAAHPQLMCKPLGKLGQKVSFFGTLGGTITAGLSLYDSYVSFNDYDTDAGIANALAGVSFATSTVIPLIWSSCSAAGPIGWFAALLGTIFYTLATKLKDSDLERYFKHCILRDHEAFPNDQNLFPVDYSKKLIERSKKFIEEDPSLKDYMNPTSALALLFDLIVCPTISFKTLEIVNEYHSTSPIGQRGLSLLVAIHQYYTFAIEMTFSKFVNEHSDLQKNMELYLYPNGINRGNEINLPKDISLAAFHMENDDKNNFHIRYNFSIPLHLREKVSAQSEILFALQVINTNGPKFPLSLNNHSRYMGVKFHLGSTEVGICKLIADDQTEKVKILPLKQLKQADSWK